MSAETSKGGKLTSKKAKLLKEVKNELFRITEEIILNLSKAGVSQRREDISEPTKEHHPVLHDYDSIENWLRNAEFYIFGRRKQSLRGFGPKQIDFKDVLKDVKTGDGGTKKCQKLMILGQAGIGKTTLLYRLAKHFMLSGKLVIVAALLNLSKDEKMFPYQALLSNIFRDSDSKKMRQSFQWIKENAKEVVIIIDSLDTMPFDFDTERPRIDADEAATVDVITHNLLAGNLLPNAIVISSSRESKVRNLHPTVWPDRGIVVDGLTEEAVEDLLNGFLGADRAFEVKRYIKTVCPDVWSVLTIPVFLVFTAIAFAKKSKFVPNSTSGILVQHFMCLIRSEHAHATDILDILRRLMPMCLKGIREGLFNFTPEDLLSIGVDPAEVIDLGIFIPQGHGSYLSSKLMQKDRFFLYFNHQTQQECLAALCVLSMEKQEFEVFIWHEFFLPNFTVVGRLVFGILINTVVLDVAQDLIKIPDIAEKKAMLLKRLEAALGTSRDRELLDIFIILNEGKDGIKDLVRSSVQKIDFWNVSLSPSDVQAISFVMKQCGRLGKVKLWNCNIGGAKMNIMSRTVAQSDFKVDVLDLTDVHKPQFSHAMLDMLPHVDKELNIRGWEVNENEKRDLQHKLNEISSPILVARLGVWTGFEWEEEELKAHLTNPEKGPSEGSATYVGEVHPIAVTIPSASDVVEDPTPAASSSYAIVRHKLKTTDESEDWPPQKKEKTESTAGTDINPQFISEPEGVLESEFTEEEMMEESDSDENGESSSSEDEGPASSLEKDFQKASKKKICKTQKFTPQGGSMQLYGCELLLPLFAVLINTYVRISVRNNMKSIPKYFIPISLIFGCNPLLFKKPVKVRCRCWMKPRKGSFIDVTILKKSHAKPDWEPYIEATLSETGIIEYEVSHFCELVAAIKAEDMPQYKCWCFHHDVWKHKENPEVVSFLCKDEICLEKNRSLVRNDYSCVTSSPHEQVIDIGGWIDIKIQRDETRISTIENPHELTMKIFGSNPIKITAKTLMKKVTSRTFAPDQIPEQLDPNHSFRFVYTADVFNSKGQQDEDESIEFPLNFKMPSLLLSARGVAEQDMELDTHCTSEAPPSATAAANIIYINAPVGHFVGPNASVAHEDTVSTIVAGKDLDQGQSN